MLAHGPRQASSQLKTTLGGQRHASVQRFQFLAAPCYWSSQWSLPVKDKLLYCPQPLSRTFLEVRGVQVRFEGGDGSSCEEPVVVSSGESVRVPAQYAWLAAAYPDCDRESRDLPPTLIVVLTPGVRQGERLAHGPRHQLARRFCSTLKRSTPYANSTEHANAEVHCSSACE